MPLFSFTTKTQTAILLPSLVFIIWACYFPSLSGQFILDDNPLIKNNAFIRESHSLTTYLSQEDNDPKHQLRGYHTKYYRPLINILYTLDFRIWGLDASGFRMTNLILHILTCFALYFTLHRVIKGGMGPFWAVLVFAIHPAHTETVSWVASRNNILVTLFGLLSFFFYTRKDLPDNRWSKYFSLIFFFLGLLSKEFALMLIPIFFFYDRLMGETRYKASHYYGYMAFLCVVGFYLFLRQQGLQTALPFEYTQDFLKRLFFLPYVVMFNLRMIFIPWELHNFIVEYPKDYFGWEALLGISGLLLIMGFLWKRRHDKVFVFSSFAFFLALCPTLHLIPTSAVSLVSMRWVYFPMVFIALAAASTFNKILKTERKVLFSIIMSLFSLYMVIYTNNLNEHLWKNEERFFRQEVLHFQNDFYLPEVAKLYHKKGNQKAAHMFFQQALQKDIHKGKASLYIAYGVLLMDMNRPKEAIHYLDKAQDLRPTWDDRARLFNNMGVAYFMMGNDSESIRQFLKALSITQDDPGILRNLGNAYARAGRYHEAVLKYKEALELGAHPVSTRKMLGKTYMRMGDYENALKIFEEIPPVSRKDDQEISEWIREARIKSGFSH